MESTSDLRQMNAEALREFAAGLLGQLAQKDEVIKIKQLKIDQLTHEMGILKRWRFGRRSEQLESGQRSLLEGHRLAALAAEEQPGERMLQVRVRCVRGRYVSRPHTLPRCIVHKAQVLTDDGHKLGWWPLLAYALGGVRVRRTLGPWRASSIATHPGRVPIAALEIPWSSNRWLIVQPWRSAYSEHTRN